MPVKIKRIYEKAEAADGLRILVDRVWPRGMSKKETALDEWLKEVGPSKELRKWFGHDPVKFEQFKKKYMEELETNEEQKQALAKLISWTSCESGNVTLLFGAKDEKHNQAVVLKELLEHSSNERGNPD